jgi:hypothetical protein
MDRILLWFAKWRLLPPPSSQNLPHVGFLTGQMDQNHDLPP